LSIQNRVRPSNLTPIIWHISL